MPITRRWNRRRDAMCGSAATRLTRNPRFVIGWFSAVEISNRGDVMAQRVAVVTGGMGGLGEAICIKLSKMGFTVVTTYSPGNKKSAEWLAEMKKEGHSFHAVPADVADFDSCAKAVKQVETEVGPIDVLVNNAGITRDMTFKKMGKV